MTYQMIQSVAVTGNIYQQFISYLLHESDTILLGTQNRERRLDGVPVSPTLIKQYEELQMFTILDVKWCQVEPDYLYGKAADVSGLQQLVDLLQVDSVYRGVGLLSWMRNSRRCFGILFCFTERTTGFL